MTTRLCCATAVQDEATHVETFARYAIKIKGEVGPPDDQLKSLHRTVLDPSYSFLKRFTVHTLLEGWATDEFAILARVFKSDLLGDIYKFVCADELRHVKIGLDSIREFLKHQDTSSKVSLQESEELAIKASGWTIESLTWLAELSGRSVEEVRLWFRKRHTERMRQIDPKHIERSFP